MLHIKASPSRCLCLPSVNSSVSFKGRRRFLPFAGAQLRDSGCAVVTCGSGLWKASGRVGSSIHQTPNPWECAAATRLSLQTRAANSSTGAFSSSPDGDPVSRQSGGASWKWLLLGAVTMAGVGVLTATNPQAGAFKDMLVNGPLGKSGFLAAFSLIFLSEIGDKTFFIAALLAMRLGRWISFLGSIASLTVMTAISVSIGVVFARVPDALKSSVPIGEICGILLLLYFGYRSLRDAFKTDEGEEDGELADAESAVKEAEKSGRVNIRSPVQSFIEVATLIFVAEWGDRSMLATIALGAAQNPFGVGIGAVVGHSIATGIAVLGGAIASKYVSEKTINLISGVLFLIFAAATAYGMLHA